MKKSKAILTKVIIASAFMVWGIAVAAQTTPSTKPDESIRPFKVHIPQAELNHLSRRIVATKWPNAETVKDETQLDLL